MAGKESRERDGLSAFSDGRCGKSMGKEIAGRGKVNRKRREPERDGMRKSTNCVRGLIEFSSNCFAGFAIPLLDAGAAAPLKKDVAGCSCVTVTETVKVL